MYAQCSSFSLTAFLSATDICRLFDTPAVRVQQRQTPDSNRNYLSNAVFGFALAINVPQVMEVFRNVVRQL